MSIIPDLGRFGGMSRPALVDLPAMSGLRGSPAVRESRESGRWTISSCYSPEARSSLASDRGQLQSGLSALPRPAADVLPRGRPALHGRPDLRGPAVSCGVAGAAGGHRACALGDGNTIRVPLLTVRSFMGLRGSLDSAQQKGHALWEEKSVSIAVRQDAALIAGGSVI
jgi:hypothetical protein